MNDKNFELLSMPASREPVSLQAVDRAVSELRRGRAVAVRGAGGIAVLVLAAEAVLGEAKAFEDEVASLAFYARARPGFLKDRRHLLTEPVSQLLRC